MSDSDSFISEVSDELRRDRLFALMRRWGPVAVAVVVVLVGTAAVLEWRRSAQQAAAQEFGDAIVAALELDTPEAQRDALLEIEASDARAAVLAMLAGGTGREAGDLAAAADRLRLMADNSELPRVYRDLATLKLVMLKADTMSLADKEALLEPLMTPGAPFRLLAVEQMALAHISEGETDIALEQLDALLDDAQATQGLRRRVQQLIVALGGSLDAPQDDA